MKAAKKKKADAEWKQYVDRYRIEFDWSDEDQAFVARVPELPGCVTHGETLVEAVKMATEAIELHLESMAARGIEIPIPLSMEQFSGKMPLRISPILHRHLVMRARAKKTSVNRLIEKTLEKAREHDFEDVEIEEG